jgi:hypothetical protein
MKKSLVLSILGLTAVAATSYGQGSIAFNTYNANSNSGIITTFAAGLGQGNGTDGIGSTFTGVLLWSSVNLNDVATTGPVTAGSTFTAGWNVGPSFTFATGAASAGYIISPSNLNIAAAVGQNIFFEVAAYTGASYATAGGFAGHSASFAGTLVTGTTLPFADQINNLHPFQVYNVPSAVPEPSTLALAGLGGFGMLMAMRRKKA